MAEDIRLINALRRLLETRRFDEIVGVQQSQSSACSCALQSQSSACSCALLLFFVIDYGGKTWH